MLPFKDVHPNEIQVDSITLQPGGGTGAGGRFTAKLKIGNASVFYFGMINEKLEISNEAVTGRSSDNAGEMNSTPGGDLGDVF